MVLLFGLNPFLLYPSLLFAEVRVTKAEGHNCECQAVESIKRYLLLYSKYYEYWTYQRG